jgi:hypothetical protein
LNRALQQRRQRATVIPAPLVLDTISFAQRGLDMDVPVYVE